MNVTARPVVTERATKVPMLLIRSVAVGGVEEMAHAITELLVPGVMGSTTEDQSKDIEAGLGVKIGEVVTSAVYVGIRIIQ